MDAPRGLSYPKFRTWHKEKYGSSTNHAISLKWKIYRNKHTKHIKYIFTIYRDEYERYYFGPFTLTKLQKERLDKELIKYNEAAKKLVEGKAPKKAYKSEADKEYLMDTTHGEQEPLSFEIYSNEDEEWDMYIGKDNRGVTFKLNNNDVRDLLSNPFTSGTVISIGYKVLPETKKLLYS